MTGSEEPAVPPARLRPQLAGQARAVLAGLLILVVFAGVRAVGPAVDQHGPWHDRLILLCALLEVALATLLVALPVAGRRWPGRGHPARTLRQGLQRTIILIMIATAAFAVFSRLRPHAPVTPPQVPLRKHPTAKHPRQASSAGNGPDVTHALYALLAILLLAAIIGCVVVILRMRKLRGPAGYADEIEEDEHEGLRRAVESGRAALRTFDDAQAAIIACYVAMETSLASAGAARGGAETPDELLARAGASGLLRGNSAAQLTALFYEARFSSHSLPPAAKELAGQALAAISAELRDRATGAAALRDPVTGLRP